MQPSYLDQINQSDLPTFFELDPAESLGLWEPRRLATRRASKINNNSAAAITANHLRTNTPSKPLNATDPLAVRSDYDTGPASAGLAPVRRRVLYAINNNGRVCTSRG